MGTKSAPWFVGASLLAILIFAAAWFLAVSPRLESAALKQEETVLAQARVDQLEIQLTGLQKDYENIEAFRTTLAGLRVQIPTDESSAELVRALRTMASDAGVTQTSVVAHVPTEIVPAVDPNAVPVDPAAAAEGTEATEAAAVEGAAATDPAVVPAPAGVTGFYALPIDMTVVGGYEQTLDFVNRLQAADGRLILVHKVQATSQPDAPATETRPATVSGDLETRLSLFAFVLPADGQMTVVPEGEVEEPAPLPQPSGQKNPFSRIG